MLVYSNKIIEEVGEKKVSTLYSTFSATAALLGAFIAFFIIEKITRKTLLLSSFLLITFF